VAAGGGDSRDQLRHRAAFLDRGYLRPIAAAIADCLQSAGAEPAAGHWRVLDAGTGTGHHLARLTRELGASVVGLGVDISKDAARHASRAWPALAFAVTDLWSEWRVPDCAVDIVLNVFAPKNVVEAARVLMPAGWLALVYPGPDHLVELTERFGLLRQQERKTTLCPDGETARRTVHDHAGQVERDPG
jgi:23S rRNA (guanine745-N1)-methyltransferase